MAIPKFLEDLLIISKLGDNPGADNGLSSSGLRSKFDEAGLKIQKYINDTLIPALSGLSNPEEGLNMKNDIAMGGHRVTGLGEPVADGDAVPRGYANGHFAPAIESAEYTGCYYRMVNGEKEWINPPMIPGVEYRTTERYEGKPVYTKLVELGTAVNGEIKRYGISNIDEMLRAYGRAGENPLPYEDHTGAYCKLALATNACYVNCSDGFVGQAITATLFYTKTT